MPKCDAVFVSLALHDVAGRPAVKIGKADLILDCWRPWGWWWWWWGIDCSFVQFSDARDTSATILPACSNGGHPCLHYRGASDEVFATEEELDSVLNCKCFHHTGTGLLKAAAKARGVLTCVYVIHLSEGTLDVITPLLLYVDYFTLSLEEAAYIPSSDDPIEVANFFALGEQTCMLKDGVRGLYLIKRDSVQRVPAYVLRASDFMGSGDAYSGSFIGVWRVACGTWRGAEWAPSSVPSSRAAWALTPT